MPGRVLRGVNVADLVRRQNLNTKKRPHESFLCDGIRLFS
jgi:hypothetical protein